MLVYYRLCSSPDLGQHGCRCGMSGVMVVVVLPVQIGAR